jgi:Tol biopolymer transport system component
VGEVAESIRAEVRLICGSPQFASADRLQRFLHFIVEETIARPETPLKEWRVGVEVYGRPSDYDPRLDSIVRVEAGKLRARLSQYYDAAGKIDTVQISVPKGGYVPVFEFTRPKPSAPKRRGLWIAAGATVLITVSAVYFLGYRTGKVPVSVASRIERISPEREWAFDPSMSRDGKWAAYAAAARNSRFTSLWLQDLRTGGRKRLTDQAANDSSPSLSADGRHVAFRSSDGEGGLFMIPTDAGAPVLLARKGRDPRFAPTGMLLAYWVAGNDETLESGSVYIIDAAREHEPYPGVSPAFQGFAHAQSPVWCDSGQWLLAFGTQQSDDPQREYDLWAQRIQDGRVSGAPVKTGLLPLLRDRGVIGAARDRRQTQAGTCTGGYVYLTTPAADGTNLARVALSPSDGLINGEIQYVLPSPESLSAPQAAGDRTLVFANRRTRSNLWSVQLTEVHSGAPITTGAGPIRNPSVSTDGAVAAWQVPLQKGGSAIVARVVKTGKEVELARGPVDWPSVSPDGDRVVWRAMDGKRQAIEGARISEPGTTSRVCADCGVPTGWSSDGKQVLFETGDTRTALEAVDTVRGKRRPVLSHPSHPLYGARYFPDRNGGGWITFYAATGPNTRQIFIAFAGDLTADAKSQWIPVTDGREWDAEPCWSEAGDAIYFVSRRGSVRGVWRQKLNGETKRPVGDATLVYEPGESAHVFLPNHSTRHPTGLNVAAGRLFFALEEAEGGIWRVSN